MTESNRLIGRIINSNGVEGTVTIAVHGQGNVLDIRMENWANLNNPPELGDLIYVNLNSLSSQNGFIKGELINVIQKTYRQDLFKTVDEPPREIDIITDPQLHRAIRLRAQILRVVRTVLNEHGFLEVETPILLRHHDIAPVEHFKVTSPSLPNQFYLRICPENYLKRLIVAGFDRVFEIGKSFRSEGHTTKNSPEFTTMECYQMLADYKVMMSLTEEIVRRIVLEIKGTSILTFRGQSIDVSIPWKRKPFLDAVDETLGISLLDHPDASSLATVMLEAGLNVSQNMSRRQLINVIAETVEAGFSEPTFLIDHPAETISVAKRHPSRPELIERFEGFIGGLELAHGFTELNDPVEQRQRMEDVLEEKALLGLPIHELDEEFLQALEIGFLPTAGLGIGIDRLVMLLTDSNLDRTITFPI